MAETAEVLTDEEYEALPEGEKDLVDYMAKHVDDKELDGMAADEDGEGASGGDGEGEGTMGDNKTKTTTDDNDALKLAKKQVIDASACLFLEQCKLTKEEVGTPDKPGSFVTTALALDNTTLVDGEKTALQLFFDSVAARKPVVDRRATAEATGSKGGEPELAEGADAVDSDDVRVARAQEFMSAKRGGAIDGDEEALDKELKRIMLAKPNMPAADAMRLAYKNIVEKTKKG